MTEQLPSDAKRSATARTAAQVAWVAGIFCVLVVIGLTVDFANRRIEDPLDAPEMVELKAELAQNPRDEALKKRIRGLDLVLREEYFQHRRFTTVGAGLLLAGAIVLLLSLKTAAEATREPPEPDTAKEMESRTSDRGRLAVTALLAVLAAAAWFGTRTTFDVPLEVAVRDGNTPDAENTAAHPEADPDSADTPADNVGGAATAEEIAANWPRLRGPTGLGVAGECAVPTEWNVPEGKNVLWKTEVPLPGNNSPVVWGDRVFLSGATKNERKVFCFDAKSGKLLWAKNVPGTPQSTAKPPKVMDDTGFAAPTMATNGHGVFAMFATGDLAAFDFEGRLAWSRSFGPLQNMYGHASSLCVFEDLLVVQIDQGGEAKDGLSRIYGLNTADGTTAWETARDVRNSWTSPIVVDTPQGKQLITSAAPWAISYDPKTGKELWRSKAMTQDVGPSPVYANGTAFFVNEFPALLAIATDGSGDVTESKILWKAEDGLPDTASPLATDELVLLSASYIMTCYDAKSGEMLWEEEFDASFSSSPTLVGNRLFLFGYDTEPEGLSWVIEPTREGCKRIAENPLGEKCVTSPAIVGNRIFIRGKRHLMCLGQE